MQRSYTEELPCPWDREGPMTKYLMVDKDVNGRCRFHHIDPWHMLHLGIGKSWVASGMMLLEKTLPHSNIDDRIGALSLEYRSYCKRTKTTPIISKFDKNSFGGGGANEANGSWHKAALTSNFMLFLEDYFERNPEVEVQTEQLRIFVAQIVFVVLSWF